VEVIDIDPVHNKTFRFWPNPATDYINLEFNDLSLSGSVFISVINMQGKELINVPYSERLSISSLKAGIYTVIILSDRKRIGYFRLIKTK
jgi:hypothetical protein